MDPRGGVGGLPTDVRSCVGLPDDGGTPDAAAKGPLCNGGQRFTSLCPGSGALSRA